MLKPFWKSDLFDATAAIERVIEITGGLTATAVHLRTSPQTVSTMREAGRVTNAVFALRMAELAEANGEPGITARVLSGMDAWEASAPAPDPERGRRRGKGSAASASPTVTPMRPRAEAAVQLSGTARRATSRRKGTMPGPACSWHCGYKKVA